VISTTAGVFKSQAVTSRREVFAGSVADTIDNAIASRIAGKEKRNNPSWPSFFRDAEDKLKQTEEY
jgi:hypothetical protein